jgi:protein-L-isoaspartate(D-aspartate) O-methyltransferase
MDLRERRRCYAEEIEAIANLKSPALVEAFANVPRERFLPPGPWLIRSEVDYGGGPRQTPDDDPRRVYHNIAIAIEPARQLFNGAPSLVGMCIDALALAPGMRVLHVGCATGYYSAVIAHAVGSRGTVTAVEIDEALAETARRNLADTEWVHVRHGNGTDIPVESFDAILVNAGMTHPHESWLAALRPGGRLLVPLTFTAPGMGTIGKGVMALLTRQGETWSARVVTMTLIYSAVDLRDERMNERIRDAFMKGGLPAFNRMRRDSHEPSPSCWFHDDTFCLSK